MSKMKMPEMSVVRFNESDVIVASIMLSGWNDGKKRNATIVNLATREVIFSNVESDQYDHIAAAGFEPVDGTSNQFNFWNGSVTHSNTWLQEQDSQGDRTDFDGLYRYTTNGAFERQ